MGLASILGLGKPDEVEQVLRLGLAAEIARLEAKDSSLGRRLIAYLAREEYPGVLAEIDAGVTNALGGSVGRETPRIYEMVDKLPPAVALRLAKVVALAFEKQSYGNWQWPLSQATPWVEAMFLHA